MAKRLKLVVQDDCLGRGTFIVKPALRGLTKNEAKDVLFCFESHMILMRALIKIRRVERQRKKCGVGFDSQVQFVAVIALDEVNALAKKGVNNGRARDY